MLALKSLECPSFTEDVRQSAWIHNSYNGVAHQIHHSSSSSKKRKIHENINSNFSEHSCSIIHLSAFDRHLKHNLLNAPLPAERQTYEEAIAQHRNSVSNYVVGEKKKKNLVELFQITTCLVLHSQETGGTWIHHYIHVCLFHRYGNDALIDIYIFIRLTMQLCVY